MLQELSVPKESNVAASKASSMYNIPSWMRIASGILGFLTSFLLVGLPAIALIIFDRVLPSADSSALWTFLYLGLTTVICVCLIEFMRMKALQGYVVNVRGVIFFQDSCFAIFWAILVGFIHPLLALPSIVSAGILFLAWQYRKPLKKEQKNDLNLPDFEAEEIDACGLGPAFYEMAAQGVFPSIQRLDFQTLGQWLTTSLLRRATFVFVLILSASLVINNNVSMGTAIATVFLNQLNLEVFIRCYQVQSLSTPRRDVSHLEKILSKQGNNTVTPNETVPTTGFLSIDDLKGDGFGAISADVFAGLCLTFIGPSGCGKSRILKAIATNSFNAGRVEFNGKKLDRTVQGERTVGYVPPSPINLPGTFVENVTGFDPQADIYKALELLMQLDPYEDVFRGEDLVNDRLENNFNAQGQLVSIARALYMEPSILIIDSPELFLDKASKAAFLALILKAKTEGKIVLLATDDDYLMSAADEVIKLDRGIVTDRGPMDEVLARHHERWVRVSFKPNKRDGFRLGLWLDAQLGHQFDHGFRERVKLGANDLLFLAPRDSFGVRDEESLIDLKVGLKDVVITLHDRGEILEMPESDGVVSDVANMEVLRLLSNTDQFQQRLKEGYRQITVRFSLMENEVPVETAIGA
ncbi:ATP-binding cassette domain-containing protein [Amylibacter sp. SFDW26]|uniref:ATP-binding cassette domain-containing protein n=1 Tax=Amylibacter sp. SFDW26 TaxID=2652722 RepID=UPI0012622871|nr:ATP-binding cassette domain-containing protein [Amylibacter sp. SFDW26]KAB7614737.1 ATP-binding cassette domain-containing protein [Amylibacter sp. SFDW26]